MGSTWLEREKEAQRWRGKELTKEKLAEVERLNREDLLYPEIERRTGVSAERARRLKIRQGIPRGRRIYL